MHVGALTRGFCFSSISHMELLALTGFGLAAGWIVYAYGGYPMVVWAISLVKRIRPVIREEHMPAVSVLIAARNEEQDIGWKIAETLQWDYPGENLEILIASD